MRKPTFKDMNPKNIAIIAVAAVVIAGCLVVSFLNEDDGGQPHIVRDSQIGDVFTYLETAEYADGDRANSALSITIVGEYADGDQYLNIEWNDGSQYMDVTEGRYWIASDVPEGNPDGTATVVSPIYGEVLCDVYVDEPFEGTTTWYVSGTTTYVGETRTLDDGTILTWVLLDSTAFSEEAPAVDTVSSTVADTAGVGDYCAYDVVLHSGDGTVLEEECAIYAVLSAEGDEITFGWIDMDETYTGTSDEFVYMKQVDPSESLGTFLFESVYGTVECYLVEEAGDTLTEKALVGKDDGLVYFFQHSYDDGRFVWYTLTGSSLVCGPQKDMSGARELPEAGDTISYITFTSDGSRVSHYNSTVLEYLGDDMYRIRMDTFGGKAIEYSSTYLLTDYEVIGTETLLTPFGAIECNVKTFVDEYGMNVRLWDAPNGLTVKAEFGEGDSMETSVLVATSMFDPEPPTYSSCVVMEPRVGDICTYSYTAVTGGVKETELHTMTVTDVDGGRLTFTDAVGNEGTIPSADFYGCVTGDLEPEYRALLETAHGYRMCDVYAYSDGDGTSWIWVGADDGVEYAIVNESENGDSSMYVFEYGTGVF